MRALTAIMLIACGTLWTSAALANQPDTTQSTHKAPLPAPSSLRANHQYSADTLYNLANSYARAGKPGQAVLNYERAALLSPNDPDINANLEYVRATAHVPTESPTRLARIALAVGPTSAAWLGVIGIALLGGGLLTHKGTSRYRGLRTGSILLGIGLISLTVSNALFLWPRIHAAVVLVNQTPARVSPVPMGDTAFELREAETVTMTSEHEEFVLIRTRSGRTGWVARANLDTVVP
jgi:SH3-like domain-containing protein